MAQALKKTHHYVWARIFFVFCLLVWNVPFFLDKDGIPDWRVVVATLPFALLGLSMLFSASAFRWDYSILGKLERSRPTAAMLQKPSRRTNGRVGMFYLSWPYFVWFVSEEGLGFKALGIGTGIVPAEAITQLKKWRFGGYRIRHNSPEIRNPIDIPGFVGRDLEKALVSRGDRSD